jgi:threonine aldolase
VFILKLVIIVGSFDFDFFLGSKLHRKELNRIVETKNISISSMGHGKLRIVTHLDYREVMHTYVLETLEKLV